VDHNGVPALVWRQLENGIWRLYGCQYRNNDWTAPVLVSDSTGDRIDPLLVVGKDNSLWIAFTERTGEKMEVRLVCIDERFK